ncbi:MAG: hypothetical protein P1U46_00120 [Patescibacteria group bacterium]|nr:hypothetical protein [Patescibacteria group bacterium]
MKMDISLSDSKIEASENSYSILNVELKDVYNNLVFTDDTTKINIEVLEKYSSILKPDTFSSISK